MITISRKGNEVKAILDNGYIGQEKTISNQYRNVDAAKEVAALCRKAIKAEYGFAKVRSIMIEGDTEI
jgi:hypothetical protein